MPLLACDLSNYSTPLSPDALAQWKAAGIGLAICQAIDPPPGYPTGQTRTQIQACLDAGLAVDAYVWLWFDLDVSDIQHKLGLLDGLTIRQLWLDVEDTAAQKYDQATTEAKITAALGACDAYATSSGERTGIYTGAWFWTNRAYVANSTTFADRELWDAHYDGQPDAAANFASYGGWTRAAIKQYAGTSTVGGIGNVDLDVLSVAEAGELDPPQTVATAPARETPDDYPANSWRESAIAYRGALDVAVPQRDALSQQLYAAKAALAQEQTANSTQASTLASQIKLLTADRDRATADRNKAWARLQIIKNTVLAP